MSLGDDIDPDTREIARLRNEVARLEQKFRLARLAMRDLLQFRCFDGVACFDRSKNSGYSEFDEYAPFLTEAFLYNSVGKDTARSILARVRTITDFLGLTDTRFEAPDLTEDEEVELEMAKDMRHPDTRRYYYGRADTPKEKDAAKIEHEKSVRERVQVGRRMQERFLAAIRREMDEADRLDEVRRERAAQRAMRVKLREIATKRKSKKRKVK